MPNFDQANFALRGWGWAQWICYTREAAQQYLCGGPWYLDGRISEWAIREWSNMFAEMSLQEKGGE
jgi:hypothetical protein